MACAAVVSENCLNLKKMKKVIILSLEYSDTFRPPLFYDISDYLVTNNISSNSVYDTNTINSICSVLVERPLRVQDV